MIEPVTNIAEVVAPSSIQKAGGTPDFAQWFSNELSAVNSRLTTSETDSKALATGEVQSLHEVMIRMEESRHSFQLMVQVRNRLLEAYQEVMRMSV